MKLEEVMLRLFLSAIFGAIIGSDRVIKGRPAGIKTHALVALGACLAMLMGEYIFVEFGDSQDVSRLAAQVISGIGFLGAGTIINRGVKQITGLTTAAGLWFAGILGIALGGGYYDLSIMSMIVWAFIFVVLSQIDHHLQKLNDEFTCYIQIDEPMNIVSLLYLFSELNLEVFNHQQLTKDEKQYIINGYFSKQQSLVQAKTSLSQIKGIKSVEFTMG
ncbi:MAG: MgtC/SapB family protein [Erysipelothrix sp.]|nr:MgtC/SapB family protein [Erysipelothrix sp.]